MAKLKTKVNTGKPLKKKNVSSVKNIASRPRPSKVVKKKPRMYTKKPTGQNKRKWRPDLIRKQPDRGVVYLSHVPHGFYEEQIENYFQQFGKITNVSVPRSETGKARGYAFVEFKHPEVAKIAAETMDNYLMFNRVIKAKYMEPKEQKPKLFYKAKDNLRKNNSLKDRALRAIEANRERTNQHLELTKEGKAAAKLLNRCKALQKKAETLGLTSQVEIKEENAEIIKEHYHEIVLKREKVKVENEKKTLAEEKAAKEAERKAAEQAAIEERTRIIKEKKAGRKKKSRALKKLQVEDPARFEEEIKAKEARLKLLKLTKEENKIKKLKRKAQEKRSKVDKKNTNKVEPKVTVGGKSKKRKQKPKLQLKQNIESLFGNPKEPITSQKTEQDQSGKNILQDKSQKSKIDENKVNLKVLSPSSTNNQSKNNKRANQKKRKLQKKLELKEKNETKKENIDKNPTPKINPNTKLTEKSSAVPLKSPKNKPSKTPAAVSVKSAKKLKHSPKVSTTETSFNSPRKQRNRSRKSKE